MINKEPHDNFSAMETESRLTLDSDTGILHSDGKQSAEREFQSLAINSILVQALRKSYCSYTPASMGEQMTVPGNISP